MVPYQAITIKEDIYFNKINLRMKDSLHKKNEEYPEREILYTNHTTPKDDSHPIMGPHTLFHPFHTDIPIPTKFNNPFHYTPHPLCILAAEEVQKYLISSEIPTTFKKEIAEGKMFGILVVQDPLKDLGYFASYGGQICGRNNWEGFVPAIFDYLQPDGYFKRKEAEITNINRHIDQMEHSVKYHNQLTAYNLMKRESEETINEKKEIMKKAKQLRDKKRSEGQLSKSVEQDMIHESQFLKAEVHRTKRLYDTYLDNKKFALEQYRMRITNLRFRRKAKSDALQQWLFNHFFLCNPEGEEHNLLEIYRKYYVMTHPSFRPNSSGRKSLLNDIYPPAGCGECCEPKLLQYANFHHLRPVCMAMFWWGKSPKGEIRKHLHYYPACESKCRPILWYMLPKE